MGLSNQSRKVTTPPGIGIPGASPGAAPPPLPSDTPQPARAPVPAAPPSRPALPPRPGAASDPIERRVRVAVGLGRVFLWILFLLLLAAGAAYLLLRPALEASAEDPDGRGLAKVWTQSRRATLEALEKVAERGQNINLDTLADQIPGGRKFQSHAAESDEVMGDEGAEAAAEHATDEAPLEHDATAGRPSQDRPALGDDDDREPATVPVSLAGWPPLEITAVVGAGRTGVAKINGRVISVGEETPDGVRLESVERGQVVLTYRGERRRVSAAGGGR